MKGTVHNIHKLDDIWIFKSIFQICGKDVPQRYPFILDGKSYNDGDEILGRIVIKEGVEFVIERPN
jgi:hypothetical protein